MGHLVSGPVILKSARANWSLKTGRFFCKNGNCANRTFDTFELFCFHIRTLHADDPSISLSCGIDNCQRQFKLYHSFRKHCLRCHKGATNDNIDIANCEDNEWEVCGLGDDSFMEEGNVIEPLLNTNEFIKNIQNVLAVFSLRIRELHCIPAAVHTDHYEQYGRSYKGL